METRRILRQAHYFLGRMDHLHQLSDTIGRAQQAGLADSQLFDEQMTEATLLIENAETLRIQIAEVLAK